MTNLRLIPQDLVRSALGIRPPDRRLSDWTTIEVDHPGHYLATSAKQPRAGGAVIPGRPTDKLVMQ